MPDATTEWVKKVVLANRDKNFIDRVSNPGAYPTLNLGKGKKATHLMAWGEVDGKAVVFPEVIYDKATKKLRKLPGKEAFEYALRNGEYVSFPNKQSAELFSKEYKRLWADKEWGGNK